MEDKKIPLLDCPTDYLIGDASGKIMNEYGRFPCKIQCGVYAFMVRGSARATINITQYEFNQHDALMLEPGSFLLIHEFSEDALVYYILFSSAFLEKNTFSNRMSLDAMQVANPIIHLENQYVELVEDLYHFLQKASNCQPSALSSKKMVHYFNLLQVSYAEHAHLLNTASSQPINRSEALYQKYTKLVCEHYREWHHVTQYAEAMHITLPHLCSTVRKVCGRKAGDIIDEAILTDAKAQLKLTREQVKVIAMSLGFDNETFFYRYFKQQVGITPKEYRNS